MSRESQQEQEQEQELEVWPIDDINEEDESFGCNMFSILIHGEFLRPPPGESEEEEHYLEDFDYETLELTWNVERDLFGYDVVHDKLVELGIPVERFMVRTILDCADGMTSDMVYLGRKVLRMHLAFSVILVDQPFSIMDYGDNMLRYVPAPKISMEGLKEIEIDDSFEYEECSVCLEDMVVGTKATRMPCSHLYHGNCILDWFKKSRFCPLCRFEMPRP